MTALPTPGESILESLPKAGTAPDVVPPIFRLGSEEANTEILVDDRRIMSWILTGREDQTAEIAGWSDLEHRLDTDSGQGYLLLPEGTRNAQSVLGSTEAWTGEKESVVDRAADYILDMHQSQGYYPNFSWDLLGITPDQKMLIVPPNTVNQQEAKVEPANLYEGVFEQLSILLKNDRQNQHLANKFFTKINRR